MSKKAAVPEKDVLEQEYSEFGATVSSIARKHGVSNPTVRKWLTS